MQDFYTRSQIYHLRTSYIVKKKVKIFYTRTYCIYAFWHFRLTISSQI